MMPYLRDWLRIGLLSFGGPAAQISVMHRIAVEERRWVSEDEFLQALNFCTLLPGPEAHQLSVWLGWKTQGFAGGVVAGSLFVLPGSCCMLLLSWIYTQSQSLPISHTILLGLKCAVLSIVLQAVIRLSARCLKTAFAWCVSVTACLCSLFDLLPFPLLIGLTVLAGLLQHLHRTRTLRSVDKALNNEPAAASCAAVRADADSSLQRHPQTSQWLRSCMTLLTGLLLWWLPVIACGLFAGWESLWVRLGIFFSKAAVLTFGGAYAVLSFVSRAVVHEFHWLSPSEMADGLGLAETTPGPLILVLQHVGFLAGWKSSGSLSPVVAAAMAAALTSWVTFVPSFLWVLLGAPWLQRINDVSWLRCAMQAVSAAATGLIVALWTELAGNTLIAPGGSPQPEAIVVTLIGALLTFAFRRGLAIILLACLTAGCLTEWIF